MNTLPGIEIQSLLPEWSKAELIRYSTELVAERSDGGDVLGLLVQAAKLELMAATIKDHAKVAGLSDVLSYGKGGVSRQGVTLTTADVGVKYDYSVDPVWQRLNDDVADATAIRKQQETFLRALPYEGRMAVDELTGETYQAYPPAKSGGEGVIVKIL